jgi:hypothetical protein
MTALLVPAAASANWIYTTAGSGAGTVTINGVANNVNCAAWTSYFYTGSSPYGEPASGLPGSAPGGSFYNAITYCSSPREVNSGIDAYDIVGPQFLNGGFSGAMLNQISFVINAAESALAVLFPTADTNEIRGGVQTAIWRLMGETLSSFSNADTKNVSDYLVTQAASATTWNSGDRFLLGLPSGSPNQNMVWTINGPNGGIDPGPVPVPASLIGVAGALAMLLAGRRLFGVVA